MPEVRYRLSPEVRDPLPLPFSLSPEVRGPDRPLTELLGLVLVPGVLKVIVSSGCRGS